MRRGQFLGIVASALGLPTAARAARPVPQLRHLRASNGSRPFAGDTPMLATISPRRGLSAHKAKPPDSTTAALPRSTRAILTQYPTRTMLDTQAFARAC